MSWYFVFIVFQFLMILVLSFFLFKKNKADGLLNIDTTDPEKDYYDFVVLTPTDDIPKKKYLRIEVMVNSQNSPGDKNNEKF